MKTNKFNIIYKTKTKTNKMKKGFFVFFSGLFIFPVLAEKSHEITAQAGQNSEKIVNVVYKWKDKNGVSHYSDDPKSMKKYQAISYSVETYRQKDIEKQENIETNTLVSPPKDLPPLPVDKK